MDCPREGRTVQKALVEGNIAFYAEWRCVSGATPVFDLYYIQSKVVR